MNQKRFIRQPPSLLIDDETPSSGDAQLTSQIPGKVAAGLILSARPRYFWSACIALVITVAVLTFSFRKASHKSERAADPASFGSMFEIPKGTNYPPRFPRSDQAPVPILSGALIVSGRPAPPQKPDEELSLPPPKTNLRPEASMVERPTEAQQLAGDHATSKPPPSTDVDVLVALMRYSDDHESSQNLDLRDRLESCPAPNTQAGIQCRQNICRQSGGEVIACPGQR